MAREALNVWSILARVPGFNQRVARGKAQLATGDRVEFDFRAAATTVATGGSKVSESLRAESVGLRQRLLADLAADLPVDLAATVRAGYLTAIEEISSNPLNMLVGAGAVAELRECVALIDEYIAARAHP